MKDLLPPTNPKERRKEAAPHFTGFIFKHRDIVYDVTESETAARPHEEIKLQVAQKC